MPEPWGQTDASSVPDTCFATSAEGEYKTATNTEWPTTLTPGDGQPDPTSTSTDCTTPTAVAVTFNVLVETSPGQDIFIAGSNDKLGSWDPDSATPLLSDKYTDENPLWYETIDFPSGESMEYKYLRKDADGKVAWESDPNRSFSVSKKCGVAEETQDDTWR